MLPFFPPPPFVTVTSTIYGYFILYLSDMHFELSSSFYLYVCQTTFNYLKQSFSLKESVSINNVV